MVEFEVKSTFLHFAEQNYILEIFLELNLNKFGQENCFIEGVGPNSPKARCKMQRRIV